MKNLENLEFKIALFLRYGVILSGLLMFTGWMMVFEWDTNSLFNFKIYDPIPLKDLIGFHVYKKDWGTLLSYLGLAILITLPFIRVLLTAVLFIKRKEFLLSIVTIVVLVGLFLSITLGIEH